MYDVYNILSNVSKKTALCVYMHTLRENYKANAVKYWW